MKILSCCPRGYYAQSKGVSYEYLSFVEMLRRMGHDVDHFDHLAAPNERVNDEFLSAVDTGYDLVIVMLHKNELLPDVLDQAKTKTVTLAWNCDDDWRWHNYSAHWSIHFTFMATTYRHVYEENKGGHANLLLSQWGCTGFDPGLDAFKDIDFSFVGLCYDQRLEQVKYLQQKTGLQPFGKNAPVPTPLHQRALRKLSKIAGQHYIAFPELPDQTAVKAIWNRSRISFTPLKASKGDGLQIKARVFDMGLSGSVMICNRNEALHEFYKPGEEFLEYEDMEDCIDQVKFHLDNETERRAIARRYAERTQREHLWKHRYEELFKEMGLR